MKTWPNFGSIAYQLPELGLLTLAMLIPIISGGLNLAIIATANRFTARMRHASGSVPNGRRSGARTLFAAKTVARAI